MAGARHHKPHPNGVRHQMTPEWKADVYRALGQRDLSEQWLADRVAERRGMRSMKRDTINKMLRYQQSSALVPDVCAVLGLSMPMVATQPLPDEETKRAIDLMLKAPPEVRRAVLLLLEGRDKLS